MSVSVRIVEGGQSPGLAAPLAFSLMLHGALVALALVPMARPQSWGEAASGGGSAVAVNLTAGIPLPAAQAPANPLATDTRTLNPPEKTAPPAAVRPSAKEVQIEQRREKKLLAEMERKQLRQELAQLRQPSPQEIPGEGSRASSTLFGRFPTGQGAGGIGFGGDFGARYGWYVRAVRECISRHWDRGRLDPGIRSAPKVFLDFEILRDGTIAGERITTSSGNPAVDREALRSVNACSGRRDVGADAHLPALPGDYAGSRVKVEVWFEFRQ